MRLHNKMHACRIVIALVVISIVTWGSMQDVCAGTKKVFLASSETKDTRTGETVGIEITSSSSSNEGKTETATEDGVIGGIAYKDLVMANVEDCVNIRENAGEDSAIVGKLYKDCAGTILEKGSDWTKIKTGEVTGWVKNSYLRFGDGAVEAAKDAVKRTAVSTTDCLRVRAEASENATVIDLMAKGDEAVVLSEEGDWTKVEWDDGTTGFLSTQYVEIDDSLSSGESMEVINARAEKEKAEKAELAKQAERERVEAGRTTETVKTNNGAISGDVNDTLLLAALIQAEAGNEIYEGQVAVGTVVMNRLRTGAYGNTIYSVIYAKGQFGPAASGLVAKYYAQGPKATCISAAQEAMAGTSLIGTATHFRNIRSGYTGIVIGNHVFW